MWSFGNFVELIFWIEPKPIFLLTVNTKFTTERYYYKKVIKRQTNYNAD